MTTTKPTKRIGINSFLNSAFKEFSLYDNVRSIPTLTDGFKPSQRKAIYGIQDRGENAPELQVERLSAHISAVTDYHHGTTSMESTVIGMAANYPGTNNMNLLIPSGQFGSRLTKDAAASRYINTKFSENFRILFRKEDDVILENIVVDGEKIEPKTYIPLLPMALINGSQGTGTGHASLIMNYNPKEVAQAILSVIKGKKLQDGTLKPWYRGFAGQIDRNPASGQISIRGALKVVNANTINITELPIGVYLDQYKDHLVKLEENGFIRDFEDRSTEEGFDFVVTVPRTTTALDHETLMQKFKLISRDTENYTLWNENGILERFTSAEQIIERFVAWRLSMYEVRRQTLIKHETEKERLLNEKLRFILFYLDNVDLFKNKTKDILIDTLLKNSFNDYDVLLQMPIWNLTKEKIEQISKQIEACKATIASLVATNANKMYTSELNEALPKLPG